MPALRLGLVLTTVGDDGSYHDGTEPPGLSEIKALLLRPEIAVLVTVGMTYLFATHSIYGWLAPLLIDRGFEHAVATRLVVVLTAGQMIGILSFHGTGPQGRHQPLCQQLPTLPRGVLIHHPFEAF